MKKVGIIQKGFSYIGTLSEIEVPCSEDYKGQFVYVDLHNSKTGRWIVAHVSELIYIA